VWKRWGTLTKCSNSLKKHLWFAHAAELWMRTVYNKKQALRELNGYFLDLTIRNPKDRWVYPPNWDHCHLMCPEKTELHMCVVPNEHCKEPYIILFPCRDHVCKHEISNEWVMTAQKRIVWWAADACHWEFLPTHEHLMSFGCFLGEPASRSLPGETFKFFSFLLKKNLKVKPF
jgi:hypothetical protein